MVGGGHGLTCRMAAGSDFGINQIGAAPVNAAHNPQETNGKAIIRMPQKQPRKPIGIFIGSLWEAHLQPLSPSKVGKMARGKGSTGLSPRRGRVI
jgi:hypothetical protein